MTGQKDAGCAEDTPERQAKRNQRFRRISRGDIGIHRVCGSSQAARITYLPAFPAIERTLEQ
jgi:hypothetical protein